MRSFLTVSVVAALCGSARAESLWEAELRVGYGVAMGTENDEMVAKKTSPVTITAIGSMEVSDEPAVSTYGGLVVETVARNTFGVVGGVRLGVPGLPVRLAAGGVWIYAPATRWGATASIGACRVRKAFGLCGDLQLTAYVAGSAMAEGHTVTEVQAVLGLVFDLAGGSK